MDEGEWRTEPVGLPPMSSLSPPSPLGRSTLGRRHEIAFLLGVETGISASASQGAFALVSPRHSQMLTHEAFTAWDLSICPQHVYSRQAFLLELKGRG